MVEQYDEVMKAIRKFRDERDWMQFHDPKSMAASISIEAAELLEHFQWKNKEEAQKYLSESKDDVADEVADVALYLFEFADIAKIDLFESMKNKLRKNGEKYPVEKARGSHLKYDQL